MLTFLLFRCTNSGIPDSTFGSNGLVSTALSDSRIKAIVLDASNNIIASGQSSSQITIAKYSSTDGSLISAFGTNGVTTTALGSQSVANSVIIDSNNNIVIAGQSDSQLIIVRYTSNGIADTTFTSDGTLIVAIGSSDVGQKILNQIDGNYIISGFSDTNLALVNIRSSVSSLVTITSLTDLTTYNQSVIIISGTSTATTATAVQVYVDGILFLTVNTDTSGNWSAGPSNFLADGTHTVYAKFSGNSVSADQKTVIIDTSVTRASAFGNTIKVDVVYGDDATGVRNGLPFATVSAALHVAKSGDVVMVSPGTYNETITIPTGVIVRGISPSTCIIQKTNVTSSTDVVTMGENSNLENIKVNLTSSST